jgi:hypothetical protein
LKRGVLKVKIHILDYKEIIPTLYRPLTEEHPMFKEYLYKGRQDILVNTDIFCNNVRSKNLKETNFSLFDRTTIDDSEIIIFPIYLELFEFLGLRENIKYSLETYSSKYPDKKVVFFWNHDGDFKAYNDTTFKYKNCRIINYNTSEKTDNDIIVPFWTMENINPIEEEKQIYCSFAGSVTHQIRWLIANKIIEYNSPKFQYFGTTLPYEEYRKKLSQTTFSLCPRGAGLSSYRFFECIHANTIPVLIADDVVLPYEEDLYYPDFSIRCKEKHITDMSVLYEILQSVDSDKMLKRLKEVRHRFTPAGVQGYVHGRLK